MYHTSLVGVSIIALEVGFPPMGKLRTWVSWLLKNTIVQSCQACWWYTMFSSNQLLISPCNLLHAEPNLTVQLSRTSDLIYELAHLGSQANGITCVALNIMGCSFSMVTFQPFLLDNDCVKLASAEKNTITEFYSRKSPMTTKLTQAGFMCFWYGSRSKHK